MRIFIRFIILLLIFTVSEAKSQNRWVKVYHDETDALGEYIIESYDHGYLLLGRHEANYPKYVWLIKTDLNGDILWEKTIGDGSTTLVLNEMAQNCSGEIYLVGSTHYYHEYKDPIIIKLDSCGEKEWCKVFSYPDNMYDFADCIVVTPDGGGAVTLNFTGTSSWNDRICLTRFKPDGEILWIKCYNSSDTSLRAEDDFNLIRTPDNGFLITGFCYYEDPTHPNLYWPEPYYIKVDSSGNFQWETIVHKDDPLLGGVAWSTIIGPDSLYYYSSISHYYYDDNTSSPALLKMDMQGEIIGIYDLAHPDEYGKLFQSVFISDTTLAGSAVWGADPVSTPQAVIFDTLGNIIDSAFLLDNDYLSYVRNTFDDKLLFFTDLFWVENEQFDAYLFKLNFDLEDDTIYTHPFNYDTLCPYPITSDTIVQDDCELIVGIQEPTIESPQEPESLIIYPNPASNQINCRFSIVDFRLSMFIYDLFGRKIEEITIAKGQEQIQIDVSSYPRGIYVAVLWDSKGIIARKKFVVAR